jgi:hypothetical protein
VTLLSRSRVHNGHLGGAAVFGNRSPSVGYQERLDQHEALYLARHFYRHTAAMYRLSWNVMRGATAADAAGPLAHEVSLIRADKQRVSGPVSPGEVRDEKVQ